MGQHTWFYKSLEKYKKSTLLFEQSDQMLEVDYDEAQKIFAQADKIDDDNQSEFHNIFRTSKRESNGSYCLDIIQSREQCIKWLEENKDLVENLNQDRLNQFWDKYPKGYIEFG